MRLNQRRFPLAVHHRQVKGTANEIPTRPAGDVRGKIRAHVHTRTHTHKEQMCRVNRTMGGDEAQARKQSASILEILYY